MTIQEYLDEAQTLERELEERLAQIEPATRVDAVKGQLRDWRARLDQLQKSITAVPPDGRREAGIEVDRKILADLAVHDPAAFTALVDKARSALSAA